MAYALTEFDGLTLPAYKEANQSDNLGTGVALTSYAQTPGGQFYDNYGSGVAPLGQDPIVKESRLIESSTANLRIALDALRAKKGKRGILKATFHDTTVRWLYARMVDIHHPALRGNLRTADVQMIFMPEGGVWYHATQTTASGVLTATGGGTQDVVVSNAGNVNVVDLVVTVTAGATTITALTIANTTASYTTSFSGTIATTKALAVDVGAMSVLNDGANAYSSFTPTTNKAQWLILQPGNNTIRFTVTGNATTNATYSIVYYSAYA